MSVEEAKRILESLGYEPEFIMEVPHRRLNEEEWEVTWWENNREYRGRLSRYWKIQML